MPVRAQSDHVCAINSTVCSDGKCICCSIVFPDHSRKTIGVILPSSVGFDADAPEIMEIVAGKCRVRIGGAGDWNTYDGGQRFRVPGNFYFDLEALGPVQYVCYFVSD